MPALFTFRKPLTLLCVLALSAKLNADDSLGFCLSSLGYVAGPVGFQNETISHPPPQELVEGIGSRNKTMTLNPSMMARASSNVSTINPLRKAAPPPRELSRVGRSRTPSTSQEGASSQLARERLEAEKERKKKEKEAQRSTDQQTLQTEEDLGVHVLDVLGEGGFGRVFFAVNTKGDPLRIDLEEGEKETVAESAESEASNPTEKDRSALSALDTPGFYAVKAVLPGSDDKSEREVRIAQKLREAYIADHPELVERIEKIPVLKQGAKIPNDAKLRVAYLKAHPELVDRIEDVYIPRAGAPIPSRKELREAYLNAHPELKLEGARVPDSIEIQNDYLKKRPWLVEKKEKLYIAKDGVKIPDRRKLRNSYLAKHQNLVERTEERPILKEGAHVPFMQTDLVTIDSRNYIIMEANGKSLRSQLEQLVPKLPSKKPERTNETIHTLQSELEPENDPNAPETGDDGNRRATSLPPKPLGHLGTTPRTRESLGTPFGFERADKIAKQLLNLGKFLEKRNILLQDVKPANILLDEESNVSLIDFNLATDFTDEVSPGGTMGYMSQDQYLRKPVKIGNDADGFAQTLRNLLIGRTPSRLEDQKQVAERQAFWGRFVPFKDYVMSPHSINRNVPPLKSAATWVKWKNTTELADAWDKAEQWQGDPKKFYGWIGTQLKRDLQTDPMEVYQRIGSSRELSTALDRGELGFGSADRKKLKEGRELHKKPTKTPFDPTSYPLPITYPPYLP